MDEWAAVDRATLDDAYANAPHIPAADAFPPRWAARARAFRAALGDRVETIPYGEHPRERLDLLHPEGAAEGLVVFLHGGYWRAFDRGDWSHLAAGALARGHAVAVPGHVLAPEKRIGDIRRGLARAVDVAAARVAGPVRLAGHSAGGHLAARLCMPDAAPCCAARIAACVAVSPLSDLRPLTRLALNEDWRLDADEARAESPVLGRPSGGVAVAVHVGADERPAFLWQAERLAQAWDAPLRRHPGRHHFDVVDALEDPGSGMVADLLA